MHHLDYDREEIGFELQHMVDPGLFVGPYEARTYPNEVTTTVYFGATSEDWDGINPLSHLGMGIKARFYEGVERGDLFLLDGSECCVVELKGHKGSHGFSTKVKASHTEPIAYCDFLAYIADLSEDALMKQVAFQPIAKTLIDFIREHRITGLYPVGASSYVRKHFMGTNHRISLDMAIRYYVVAMHDKDTVFSRAFTSDRPVLEVKKDRSLPTGELPAIQVLEQQGIAYWRAEITKGMRIGELFKTPHVFVEPELVEKADNDWVITEREIKLDAQSDPRPICRDVYLGNGKDVFGGMPIVNVNYQRIYDVGPAGIVYMSADTEGSDPMLKYKFILHNDRLGALVRKEVVVPYTPDALSKVAKELDPSVNIKSALITPYFCRDRIKCNVYMRDSRNVFEIYGDRSVFLEGEYNDFHQVEIEYAGVICKKGDPTIPVHELENCINTDFAVLRSLVLDVFATHHNPLMPSTRSKYDWASAEVFRKDSRSSKEEGGK